MTLNKETFEFTEKYVFKNADRDELLNRIAAREEISIAEAQTRLNEAVRLVSLAQISIDEADEIVNGKNSNE